MRSRSGDAPPDDVPFALVERGPHGIVLTAVNQPARAAGLRIGQRHADAQAIVPRLSTEPARPDHDAATLAELAHWCVRWSPSVAICPPDGVFIDCGGSAHLFGGEDGLLADIARRLGKAGIEARAAIAAIPGAAWGAARFGGQRSWVLDDDIAPVAAPWPIAALRVDDATRSAAASLGLKRIGDLYGMPRAGLARRFGGDIGLGIVERLDQLLGHAAEALTMIAPPQAHAARIIFAEPVTETAGVEAALPALIADLATQLTTAALGALVLRLAAFRIDGGVTAIGVRLGAASRDPRLWQRLLAERGLDHLDLGFGIDAVSLAAGETGPVVETMAALGAAEAAREPLPELIDRLAARLGGDAVQAGTTHASWLPERAERWLAAQGSAFTPATPLDRERPLILLDPPEPIEAALFAIPEGAPSRFRWRRVERRVRRAEGPERLAPEWWRNLRQRPRRTRDYYRVEDDTGARFWLFREGLYGWEDGEAFADRTPTWWMHGLFA